MIYYQKKDSNRRRSRLAALTLALLSISLPAASAEFYLASNFGNGDNWLFDQTMDYDEATGSWNYRLDVSSNGDYYFTFFNEKVGGWQDDRTNRFGAQSKDLEPVSGTSYLLQNNTENCFKIPSANKGTYTISITDNGGYVTFTKVEDGDDDNDQDQDKDQNQDPTPTPGDEYTYYFDNSQSNWSEVYAYAWNGGVEYYGKWPGEQISKNEDGLYVAKLEKDKVNASGLHIIFNNNSGQQTADLPAEDGYTYTANTQPEDVSGGGGGESGGESGDDQQKPDPSYSSVGKISGYEEQGQDIVFYGENATITLTPYADNVVKVFTLVNGAQNTEERKSITVVREPEVDYTVKEILTGYEVKVNGTLAVIVNGETGRLSFQDYTTKDTKDYTSEATSLINNHNNRSVAFESTGTPAALYGGGYNGQQESVLGRYMEMNNTQIGDWHDGTTGPRCINIPFVVSTDGYGILFDDHYRGGVIESSDNRISYKSGANDPISYYFIGGGSLDEVVANYTNLTGRQDLPPYWALGYITSRYGYKSTTEGDGVINDIRKAGIPLDGIVFDLYWQGKEENLGTLNWSSDGFSNAIDKVAEWKQKGIHTTLITEPFFTQYTNGNYDYLKEKGYLADEDVSGMGWLSDRVGLLDASNPEALDWMWTFYKERTDEGVDGWWLDLGEPERHDDDSKHMGGSVSQVHNEFGNLWVERVYRGLREDFPKMRPFIMPRAGTSGMQRFSTFPWTGDIQRSWGGLRAQIPSLINMSMAGVSYIGSDVGGFTAQETNAKLYQRWVQFAALSPMCRTHSPNNPEPTYGDYDDIRGNVRDYIRLRYRLLPYTYTLAYENSAYGYPMARPACAFDTDKARLTQGNSYSYLWGRDIFVAPVVHENANSRDITFPQGSWLDLHEVMLENKSNAAAHSGNVSFPAPDNKLPFFLHQGSFLPTFTEPASYLSTNDLSYSDLTVYHYIHPENKAEFNLYIDDRESTNSLDEGKHSLIKFRGFTHENIKEQYLVAVEPDEYASNFETQRDGSRIYRFHIYGSNFPKGQQLAVTEAYNPEELDHLVYPSITRANTTVKEPDVTKVDPSTSLEAAQAAEGHSIYYGDNGYVYVQLKVPANEARAFGFGDTSTGVDGIAEEAQPTVSGSNGMIRYYVPTVYSEAQIEVYSADGRHLATYTQLDVDGATHILDAPEADGVSIVRLTAGGTGRCATATAKLVK